MERKLAPHEYIVNVTHYPKNGYSRQHWFIEIKSAARGKIVYKNPNLVDGTVCNNLGAFLNWLDTL